MSDNGKRVMERIIERMPEIKNENVLKSIGLIIGDCAVDENGEERADWIMHIILTISFISLWQMQDWKN
jgi:hypothetical protein